MLIYARSSVKEANSMLRRSSRRPAAVPRLLAAALIAAAGAGEARAAPDGERAFRHVLQLAGTIGPRKTGTEGERRAVDYLRAEMESAGLQVELQDVGLLAEPEGERAVGSRNVVGRLAGSSPETILVAAHHDSRNALVPGANDDASGLGVLLEVARATASRPRRLSYLFVSFCAEEEGLLGSTHFARTADLGRLRAVVALELLGRGEILVAPVPQAPPLWAQEALLRAARESGVRGVSARPLWSLVPRFVDLPFSSDHEPFLERGVPAFLMVGTFPAWTYHTAEDSVMRIREESLQRAATTLDRLLRDLEESPPSREDDPHYLPFVLFGQGLVVRGAVLQGIGFAGVLGTAFLLLRRLRSVLTARALGETIRVLIVGSAATALGLSGLFASEALMERIHSVRFPWTAHPGLHLAQGSVLTLVTGWLGLKLFRRIKPTVERGPYLAAALLLPVVAAGACLRLGWSELAGIASVPVLAFLASLLVRSTGRKLALGLLGALPIALLVSPADYRAAIDLAGLEIPGWALFGALFALVFPFVLFVAHVASFQDCLHSAAWWWLSSPAVGAVLFVAWAGLLVASALLPPYDASHRQVVRLRQRVDLPETRATLMLRSRDTLRGVSLRGLAARTLAGPEIAETIDLPFPAGRVGLEAEVEAAPEGPAGGVVCRTRLRLPRPTHRLSYIFTSRAGFRIPERDAAARHTYTFTEVAPQTDPERSFRLLLPEGGDLDLAVRAEFADDLLGVEPVDGPRTFVHQGTVVATRRLRVATGPAPTPR
jgi:hypothetical protein